MLEIKNIVEDIVIKQIEELEDTRTEEITENQKKEIAAYVLNRIKPMYITSNKGFTNAIAKFQNDPQFMADVMMKISDALKIVKKSTPKENPSIKFEREKLYYVFPKIYGRVISSKTLQPITKATVYLYINDILIESTFQLWKNPTEILPIDNGFFSFAPKPILATPPYEKRTFIIKINIQREDNVSDKIIFYDLSPSTLNNIKTDFHENVLQLEDIYVPF
jgi:hypothetical protein